MSNLQNTLSQKVDRYTRGKFLIHDTKHRKDKQLQSLWLSCRMYSRDYKLAQIMAFCLTASSHQLTQYWLTIGEVLWH